MRDDLTEPTTTLTAQERDFPRSFIVFALLLGLAAIGSLVIAVSVPADPSRTHVGRSGQDIAGPSALVPERNGQHDYSMPTSPGPWPKRATECAPSDHVRFTAPPRIDAVRVCGGYWAGMDWPVTAVRVPNTAQEFARLSRALAEPSPYLACLANTFPVVEVYVSVRMKGQWFGVEPPLTCSGLTLSVNEALDALFPPPVKG